MYKTQYVQTTMYKNQSNKLTVIPMRNKIRMIK